MSELRERPRPARLTVRVGVTGHRKKALAGVNEGELRKAIRQALQCVQKIVGTIHADAVPLYSSDPPLLRLLSSLADGADQIVAEEAVLLGFELQCPLPFSSADYVRSFDKESKARFTSLLRNAETVLTLDGSPEKRARPAAYLAAGRLLLWQCDILIAIWNGKPAKGKGGTGQIVEEAAALDIPTYWINPQSPESVRLRMPRSAPILETPEALSLLTQRLRESLLPSGTPALECDSWHFELRDRILRFFGASLPRSEWDRALSYFREGRPPKWWLRWLFRVRQLSEAPEVAWDIFTDRWPALGLRFEKYYRSRFRVADKLANAYVRWYRKSFSSSYLLGAFAVLFAFLGLQFAHHAGPEPNAAHEAGVPWFTIELVLILLVIAITISGSLFRLHERWMDYRPLAEALRQMKFLDLLGRVPPSSKVPAHLAPGDPGRSWFNWYFRSVVRQAGMIGGSWDRPLVLERLYLEDVRHILAEEIRGQIKYHNDKHELYHARYHKSHWVSQSFFFATAVGCLLHLLHQPPIVEIGLGLIAIVLPGFGAALSAILHQGEFERISLRSKALEGRLHELLKDVCGGGAPTSQSLGRLAETFSDIMMAELVDWRFAFLEKDLALP